MSPKKITANAQPMNAAQVERRLEARFEQIDRVAQEANLSEGSLNRIEKARRLIEGLEPGASKIFRQRE